MPPISRIPTTAAQLPQITKVLVCDTQPVTVAGVKAVLNARSDFLCAESADSLAHGLNLIREHQVDVLIIDKAFGLHAICAWLDTLQKCGVSLPPAIVVWGVAISAADTMRLIHAGARGVVHKTADMATLVACLHTAALGRIWVEDNLFSDWKRNSDPSNALSIRERDVLELVEQGLMNREIAMRLQIKPGTVKIHLKHIFQKTGVRGRHSLALSGLRDGDAAERRNSQLSQNHSAATA